MPNLRRAVMIGDADHKRATMLKEILNEEFGLEVECVETFEQVKDKLALSKYELVLIAHNLPYSYLAQDPIRPANISDLISDHLGQKVGLIKSELELRLGFKRLPNIFLIQVAQIKPLAKQPERIISELNKIFPNSWRLEKRLSKLSHSIELVLEDSPQLHEQIRSLSSSHDITSLDKADLT